MYNELAAGLHRSAARKKAKTEHIQVCGKCQKYLVGNGLDRSVRKRIPQSASLTAPFNKGATSGHTAPQKADKRKM